MDRVRLAVDLCSNLQGFFVLHSFGGGTGSGVGCEVLHDLHEATNGAGCRFLCGAPSFLFFGWCQRENQEETGPFSWAGWAPNLETHMQPVPAGQKALYLGMEASWEVKGLRDAGHAGCQKQLGLLSR